jgi:L-lactate dehydrogenase complex protein LldF
MLLALRAKLADGDPLWGVKRASHLEKAAFVFWSKLAASSRLYTLAMEAAALAQRLLPRQRQMIRRLPPPLAGWTQYRDLRPLAGKSFHKRWKANDRSR